MMEGREGGERVAFDKTDGRRSRVSSQSDGQHKGMAMVMSDRAFTIVHEEMLGGSRGRCRDDSRLDVRHLVGARGKKEGKCRVSW